MKKYRIDIEAVYHNCITVEASSEDEAVSKALDEFSVLDAEQISCETTNIEEEGA